MFQSPQETAEKNDEEEEENKDNNIERKSQKDSSSESEEEVESDNNRAVEERKSIEPIENEELKVVKAIEEAVISERTHAVLELLHR